MCTVYATPNVDGVLKELNKLGLEQITHEHTGNINIFFRGNITETPAAGRVHIRVAKEVEPHAATNRDVHKVVTYRYRGDSEMTYGYIATEDLEAHIQKIEPMTNAEIDQLYESKDAKQPPEVQAEDKKLTDGDNNGTIH